MDILKCVCVQIMWTSAVFKEPVPVIVDMLSDALLTLDPSLSSCFNSHLQQSSDILDALVELKQVKHHHSTVGKKISQQIVQCIEKHIKL